MSLYERLLYNIMILHFITSKASTANWIFIPRVIQGTVKCKLHLHVESLPDVGVVEGEDPLEYDHVGPVHGYGLCLTSTEERQLIP